MASVIENKSKKTVERVNEQLFKSSIKSWYADEGVDVSIARASSVFQTKFNNDPQVAVTLDILSDLEKIRARVVEKGEIVFDYDEVLDKKQPRIELVSTNEEGCSTVTLFMKFKHSDNEEEPILVHNKGSSFPLVNAAFIGAGLLPDNNVNTFTTSELEIKEAMEGYETTLTVEEREFNANKYLVLVVKE